MCGALPHVCFVPIADIIVSRSSRSDERSKRFFDCSKVRCSFKQEEPSYRFAKIAPARGKDCANRGGAPPLMGTLAARERCAYSRILL